MMREQLIDSLRPVLGPPVRRMRREAQWFALRGVLARERTANARAHLVASHHTPLIRELPGVDPALQRNKVVNLRLAVAALDGLLLQPGTVLSFWRLVGPPTSRRGYVDGLVLDHGRVSVGVGGGLCQLTNLLYWMTLHTPLRIRERWRHSYDVFPDSSRSQPFGSGATCAWPMLDLQIENPTDDLYRLGLTVGDVELSGEWTSDVPMQAVYSVEERGHRIVSAGHGVHMRKNELWRIEQSLAGEFRCEQLIARNEALIMYEPFLPPAPEAEQT
ncbi:MAG: VanW family protein [Coriobacteriia bacterium]|nr:VanW family protein [Coriobacteriia bacterium]